MQIRWGHTKPTLYVAFGFMSVNTEALDGKNMFRGALGPEAIYA